MEYSNHRLDLEANPVLPPGKLAKIKKEPLYQMESHAWSAVKALSWRVTAVMVTTSVVWVITREIEIAAAAGLFDTLRKVGLYYLHERLWLRSGFGIRVQ